MMNLSAGFQKNTYKYNYYNVGEGSSESALKPLNIDAVLLRKLVHQIAGQKFAWPLPSNLFLQVTDHQVNVIRLPDTLLVPELLCNLVDDPRDILLGDDIPSVPGASTGLHPLPKLDTGNLCCGSVLHEMIERNATISSQPGGGVSQSSGHVGVDASAGDFSRNIGVDEISCNNVDVLPANVVLCRTSCQISLRR